MVDIMGHIAFGLLFALPAWFFWDTIGWSLVTSGLVTLVLTYVPYPSFSWGIGLLVVGIIIFATRRIF